MSGLKSLREKLCLAQSERPHLPQDVCDGIQDLINKIDIHRPLGSNCKHGSLHTPTCGCEDI